MLVMEDTMSVTALHYSAFAMGTMGLAIVIWGVFVKAAKKKESRRLTESLFS